MGYSRFSSLEGSGINSVWTLRPETQANSRQLLSGADTELETNPLVFGLSLDFVTISIVTAESPNIIGVPSVLWICSAGPNSGTPLVIHSRWGSSPCRELEVQSLWRARLKNLPTDRQRGPEW